jgi:hypothetical protein
MTAPAISAPAPKGRLASAAVREGSRPVGRARHGHPPERAGLPAARTGGHGRRRGAAHAARRRRPRLAVWPGTGKSHLVEALAHAAIEKDLRVAWFTLETLTAAIGKAKADGSAARTVTRICRSDT